MWIGFISADSYKFNSVLSFVAHFDQLSLLNTDLIFNNNNNNNNNIIIIIVIIIIIIMLSRCYAPTQDHAQPTELCMWGCG